MKENTEQITKEFCRGKVLVFHPETEKEAEFIQHQFLNMGFCWQNGSMGVRSLDLCVTEGLVLLMSDIYLLSQVNPGKDALFCSSEQFEEGYVKNEGSKETLLTRFLQLPRADRQWLLEQIKGSFSEDFRIVAKQPVALTRPISVKPPVSFPKV